LSKIIASNVELITCYLLLPLLLFLKAILIQVIPLSLC